MDDRGADTLLRRAAAGDGDAVGALVNLHRERLVRMVRARMDRRLCGRLDASDVVQDVCVEALGRLPAYLREAEPMPFLLWMRFLAGQRLAMLHRRHLGAKARDVAREVRAARGPRPGATSGALADGLADSVTSPSEAAQRAESQARLRAALDSMDPMDREILSLRHLEQLTNAEAAAELGIEASTASKRYIRAFRRLRALMTGRADDGGERDR